MNIGSRGANVNAACKQPSVLQERHASTTPSDRSTLHGVRFTDHEEAQPS